MQHGPTRAIHEDSSPSSCRGSSRRSVQGWARSARDDGQAARVTACPAALGSVFDVADNLEIISYRTVEELWSWLGKHHQTHPGVWVRLQRATSTEASVGFNDVLEAGIAHGWSESSRRAYSSAAYLQKFTPRRTQGTNSPRNLRIADRLEAEGRMTPAGRRALGRDQ